MDLNTIPSPSVRGTRIALGKAYTAPPPGWIVTSSTEGEGGYIFTPLCLFVCLSLLLAKSKIFQFYWSVDFVILSDCLTITYRSQFQMDLHESSSHGRVCHKEEACCFWSQKVNIGQRSTSQVRLLKSSIFIWLTWNLKRRCIFGHSIQPPIIFEVKFV